MIKQRTWVVALFAATLLATFSAIHQSLTVATRSQLDEFLFHHDLGNHVNHGNLLRRENDSPNTRLLVEDVEIQTDSKKDPLPAEMKENVPSLGSSLRFMWEQLKEQTPSGQTRQKIIANLKPRAPSTRTDDIVLVTHGSLFKLDTFLLQLEFWDGPASFAVYMNSLGEKQDALDILEMFLEEHKDKLQKTSIHLYMEYTNTTKKPPAYPHNPLRNLAMDQSDSDYILALDVDFIPHPKNCYKKLLHTLHARDSSLAKDIRIKKRLMVLPAFEVYASNGTDVATRDQLPASKQELFESIMANRSESFRIHRYPAGHGPTNFHKWFAPLFVGKSKDKTPTLPYYTIFYRPGFEPYVLAYRHGLPRYWNTFRGFGQNKLSWFMELHLAGYKFGTLWDFFVIHLQHRSTLSWKERHANVRRHEAFLKYLKEHYPLKKNRKYRDNRYYFDFKMPLQWGVSNATNTSEPEGGNQSSLGSTVDPMNNFLEPTRTYEEEPNAVAENETEDASLILQEEEQNEEMNQHEDVTPRLAVDENKTSLS